jgi:hypothetical protein
VWQRRSLLALFVLLACDPAPPGQDVEPVRIEKEQLPDGKAGGTDEAKADPEAPSPARDPSDASPPSDEERKAAKANDPGYASRHDAFNKVCNATELSGANKLKDPSEQAVKTAEWIKAEVHDEGVLKLLSTLPSLPPAGRSETLRIRARLNDVSPCPMADR